MNFEETLDWLYGFQKFGMKLGLERITHITDNLGSPHKNYKIIHVGGTNGKGSVCKFLESILVRNGYTVGVYTSPHLQHISERIVVNKKRITEEELVSLVKKIKPTVEEMMKNKNNPTFFEVFTAIAFEYFKEKNVDFAIIEVGLGGRFDATNIVDPVVSVITNISPEHQNVLGKKIEDIAFEKAGIIKDHVGIFIRALEQITDTSVLANPKVLALNKQIGNIIVGRRDGYITTTVTETQAIQKVEFLETGTQLTFRPFIGTDGYVRMELHPEDSVGGLTAAQLPFEQTTEVTTNVIVRDGHTILIGGLFREVTSESRSQLPFLGDIPHIGDLFRSRSDSLDREEVIILLTVHIVSNDEVYAEESLEYLRGIERTRVGLRRGMMWHGRERLAQSYYRKAVDYFERGDNDRALWNVQMCLHNYPRFLSAIKLKDEIEQTRDWEDDATIGRDFVYQLIRRAKGIDGRVRAIP